MKLLLLRDFVLKRASFRYFCFEIDGAEVGIGAEVESVHAGVILMTV